MDLYIHNLTSNANEEAVAHATSLSAAQAQCRAGPSEHERLPAPPSLTCPAQPRRAPCFTCKYKTLGRYDDVFCDPDILHLLHIIATTYMRTSPRQTLVHFALSVHFKFAQG